MVDLRTCKKGDKLISKHGLVLTYVGPTEEGHYYDHYVTYPNGSGGTRLHDGTTYRHNRMECDHDIVEIVNCTSGCQQ